MGTAKRERQKQGRQARIDAARVAQQKATRVRTVRNFAIVIVLIVVGIFAVAKLTGGKDNSDNSVVASDSGSSSSASASVPPAGATLTGDTPCPNADGSSQRTTNFAKAPPMCIDATKTYSATFDTTEGSVTVGLDDKTTPGTTNNFVVLALYHYFDGTTLFRTDPSIGIIQGGSPHTNSPNDPGPGYDLPDEGFDYNAIGGTGGPYKYAPGDLIMARASKPNGGAAQFFFAVTDAVSNLNAQGVYVKFGSTTAGIDVLQKILALHHPDNSGLGGAPSHTVTINKVTITAA